MSFSAITLCVASQRVFIVVVVVYFVMTQSGNFWIHPCIRMYKRMKVYSKVSGLAAWSENCKWYSSLPLAAVVSLFVSQSSEFCTMTLCVASQRVFIVGLLFISLSTQSGNFWIHPRVCACACVRAV